MATHSSVLAWRIPGTGEPGELPSMGSHRVGHDWIDLASVFLCSPGFSTSSPFLYIPAPWLWFLCLPCYQNDVDHGHQRSLNIKYNDIFLPWPQGWPLLPTLKPFLWFMYHLSSWFSHLVLPLKDADSTSIFRFLPWCESLHDMEGRQVLCVSKEWKECEQIDGWHRFWYDR